LSFRRTARALPQGPDSRRSLRWQPLVSPYATAESFGGTGDRLSLSAAGRCVVHGHGMRFTRQRPTHDPVDGRSVHRPPGNPLIRIHESGKQCDGGKGLGRPWTASMEGHRCMSHKKHRRRSSSGAGRWAGTPSQSAHRAGRASSDPPAADVGIAQADLAQVGRYIAENDTKGAVKKAKALHS